MAGWDFQINRSVVTTAAGGANWQLRAATTAEASAAVSGGIPASSTDVAGGLPQTGSVSLVSGDAQKIVHHDVVPNTTPGQGTRVVAFVIQTVTPSGSVIDTPMAFGWLTEDDTGTANIFGPANTADTTLLQSNTAYVAQEYTYRAVAGRTAEFRVGFDAAQQNGVIARQAFDSPTTMFLYKMVDGVISDVSGVSTIFPSIADGDKIKIVVTSPDKSVVVHRNGVSNHGAGWGVGNLMAGTYGRVFRSANGSGNLEAVTISAVS